MCHVCQSPVLHPIDSKQSLRASRTRLVQLEFGANEPTHMLRRFDLWCSQQSVSRRRRHIQATDADVPVFTAAVRLHRRGLLWCRVNAVFGFGKTIVRVTEGCPATVGSDVRRRCWRKTAVIARYRSRTGYYRCAVTFSANR